MKTSCTCASVSSLTRFMKGFCLSLGISATLLALNAGAAVTPVSVPDGGIGPLHFDTLPGLADGWSSVNWPGSNASITNATQAVTGMDDVANTNNVAGILTPLPTDTTGSTPTTPFIILANFRWNSVDHNLESRPTGIAYNVLLLSLRNGSSIDQDHFNLEYDFNDLIPAGASENEDDADKLAGFRVYYSLSGLPGSWTHVPDFDGGLATVGHRSAEVTLAGPWEVGANLYIMWTDDNAINGSGGATGVIEGPLTLDNVVVNFGACVPPVITTQPHTATVDTCRGTNFTVVATGSGLHYQWIHAGTNLPGTDFPTLEIPIATAANAGTYKVVITNGCSAAGGVSSATVSLNVVQSPAPTVLSAIGRVDGFTCSVSFSDLMDRSTLVAGAFTLSPVGGGTVLNFTNIVIAANGQDITLKSDTVRAANTSYDLLIDQGLTDCSGTALTTLDVPLEYEIIVMTIENTPWKYDDSGTSQPFADWIQPDFDTSAWSNGIAILDAKNPAGGGPRTTVNGQTVNTQLPLTNSVHNDYVTNVIPVYFFRGSFTLPVPLSEVTAMSFVTFADDFPVIYLNGDPNPAFNGLTEPGAGATNPDPLSDTYSGGTAIGTATNAGPFAINLSQVIAGQNLVAVKLFQQAQGSSDITWGLEVLAVVKSLPSNGPHLTVSLDTGSGDVILTWPTGTGALLYQANQVDATGIGGPTGWSLVAPQADGAASVSPPGAGGVQKFYTLRK